MPRGEEPVEGARRIEPRSTPFLVWRAFHESSDFSAAALVAGLLAFAPPRPDGPAPTTPRWASRARWASRVPAPIFQEWASSVVSITRGPEDIANPNSPLASFGTPSNALGLANDNTSKVVSLGDGGSITLGFNTPIANGPGADFAVFENGFLSGGSGLAFLELATVAVSSDGVHFFTFPDVSETQTTTQVGRLRPARRHATCTTWPASTSPDTARASTSRSWPASRRI